MSEIQCRVWERSHRSPVACSYSRCAVDAWRHRENMATLDPCTPLSHASIRGVSHFQFWKRLRWAHALWTIWESNWSHYSALISMTKTHWKMSILGIFLHIFCKSAMDVYQYDCIPLSDLFTLDRRSDKRPAGLCHFLTSCCIWRPYRFLQNVIFYICSQPSADVRCVTGFDGQCSGWVTRATFVLILLRHSC